MNGPLSEKARKFSVRIYRLAKYLESKKENVIAKQMLRSGTSIRANIAESEFSVSRADFVNKLQIARKEAKETQSWIELLFDVEIISKTEYGSLLFDLEELQKMLTKSVLTSKSNATAD